MCEFLIYLKRYFNEHKFSCNFIHLLKTIKIFIEHTEKIIRKVIITISIQRVHT